MEKKLELSKFSMNELKDLMDRELCDKFLPIKGEGETMISQLTAAASKLIYKYYNDGDRYDEASMNDMSSYANWIDNHCFRLLRRDEDYEEKLKYIIINTLCMYKTFMNKEAIGSIYDEKGYFYDYKDDEDDEEDEWY